MSLLERPILGEIKRPENKRKIVDLLIMNTSKHRLAAHIIKALSGIYRIFCEKINFNAFS